MNPFKLFDLSYLFDTRPGSEFLYFWPMLVVMLAIFVGSFKLRQKNIASALRWFSGLGLVWTLVRDQNIPYLAMRFWIVLLGLVAVAYAVWYWKKVTKKAEEKPLVDHHKQMVEKYLPKKKGGKKHR